MAPATGPTVLSKLDSGLKTIQAESTPRHANMIMCFCFILHVVFYTVWNGKLD